MQLGAAKIGTDQKDPLARLSDRNSQVCGDGALSVADIWAGDLNKLPSFTVTAEVECRPQTAVGFCVGRRRAKIGAEHWIKRLVHLACAENGLAIQHLRRELSDDRDAQTAANVLGVIRAAHRLDKCQATPGQQSEEQTDESRNHRSRGHLLSGKRVRNDTRVVGLRILQDVQSAQLPDDLEVELVNA